MQPREHSQLFRKMSNAAFNFHNTDMDTLRSKYGKVQIDLPKTLIANFKRPQLINALLALEFGADAVIDYISQCREWDETENLFGKVDK